MDGSDEKTNGLIECGIMGIHPGSRTPTYSESWMGGIMDTHLLPFQNHGYPPVAFSVWGQGARFSEVGAHVFL